MGVHRGLRLKGLPAFGVCALWLGYAVPTAGVASGPSASTPAAAVAPAVYAPAAALNRLPAPAASEAVAPRVAVRRLATAASRPTPAPSPEAGSPAGLSYSQAIQGTATSYCLTGTTATGTQAGPGAIAVDPAVIRLGSHLYVTGYGYGWAVDTGSAIKGTLIDVWYPCAQAIQWGRRPVTIYVLSN